MISTINGEKNKKKGGTHSGFRLVASAEVSFKALP